MQTTILSSSPNTSPTTPTSNCECFLRHKFLLSIVNILFVISRKKPLQTD
eukprot:UN01434